MDTITKSMKIDEVKAVLHANGIATPYGWDIVLGMLLDDCEYIKIEGYGSHAQFVLCKDEEVTT